MLEGQSNLDLIADLDFGEYWTYMGSLTTPPCTEGLRWTVLKQILPISEEQLKLISKKIAESEFATVGNNRVVQPLNDRVLYTRREANAMGLFASAMTLAAVALMSF